MADLEKLNDGTPRVNVGYGRLVIDKLYGPLIFAQLEVEAVPETCEWVIRRDGVEFCRIPGQLDSDFQDELDSDFQDEDEGAARAAAEARAQCAPEAVELLLETSYQPVGVRASTSYTRRQDDTDGERGIEHDLSVIVGPDGDAWVRACGGFQSLRFRGPFGGGRSPRTYRALLVLAEAIRRDAVELPDEQGAGRG